MLIKGNFQDLAKHANFRAGVQYPLKSKLISVLTKLAVKLQFLQNYLLVDIKQEILPHKVNYFVLFVRNLYDNETLNHILGQT